MATRPRVALAPEARRAQLLAAAAWVFARRGYRAAGISDIVQRAGVARGTFYLHFESKAQIFLAIVDDFHDRIVEVFETIAAAPPDADAGPATLARGFRLWLELFAANRDAAVVILKEARAIDPRFDRSLADLRQSAVTFFADRIRRMQAAGTVRHDVSPVFVAHAQIGLLEEMVNAFVLADPDADLDVLARQLADFEWRGIS